MVGESPPLAADCGDKPLGGAVYRSADLPTDSVSQASFPISEINVPPIRQICHNGNLPRPAARIGGVPEYPQTIQSGSRAILLDRTGFQGGAGRVNFSILKSSSAMRLSDGATSGRASFHKCGS